ncbi:putative short-chain dehydrogenase [Rhexocercosporidium sp. MPI-PUGE-AT-0058]|nr:putative short-chain dehydrogenase [Rhexocercosporidium sp. MPI-PUGE-AT-0058]
MAPVSRISTIFPPAPNFTETSLPSLAGKVYIVTGAASGVGYELTKFLYAAGGTVYIAARSIARCDGAIQKILEETKTKNTKSSGRLESLVIDLADLRSVKAGVEDFLKRETRLDVLMHNAAVMTPPEGSKDKLGHDLEISTNCLAPYLMTNLLEPLLIRTANTPGTPPNSVRVVFVISMLQNGFVPGGAMSFDANGTPVIITDKFMANYMQSKNGGAWLALHFAERLGKHGIMSVSLHPGLMRTELQRNWNLALKLIMSLTTKSPVYGAYSELFAGFSPEVTPEHNGGYMMAWGRIGELAPDVQDGWKSKGNGGTGAAKKFFEYCERETKEFL